MLASARRCVLELCGHDGGAAAVFAERARGLLFDANDLARELAQTNGATLLHEARSGGGSIFRIIFSDPGRWEI